jgi:hypothetical protein
MWKRLAGVFLVCGMPLAAAGLLDFGVKGGVPFTDALEAVATTNRSSPTGPSGR